MSELSDHTSGTADGVRVVRSDTVIAARCPACGWEPTTDSYHAVRMAARRHAASTGHVVHAESSRKLYYDGRGNDA